MGGHRDQPRRPRRARRRREARVENDDGRPRRRARSRGDARGEGSRRPHARAETRGRVVARRRLAPGVVVLLRGVSCTAARGGCEGRGWKESRRLRGRGGSNGFFVPRGVFVLPARLERVRQASLRAHVPDRTTRVQRRCAEARGRQLDRRGDASRVSIVFHQPSQGECVRGVRRDVRPTPVSHRAGDQRRQVRGLRRGGADDGGGQTTGRGGPTEGVLFLRARLDVRRRVSVRVVQPADETRGGSPDGAVRDERERGDDGGAGSVRGVPRHLPPHVLRPEAVELRRVRRRRSTGQDCDEDDDRRVRRGGVCHDERDVGVLDTRAGDQLLDRAAAPDDPVHEPAGLWLERHHVRDERVRHRRQGR
mmetsp:Transcript_563/g.2328  ORF Transcript_563/g.2328 Transcript_563/m.2328 type:complete len:365 (+) Transcript_563:473-1567(+)